MTAGACSSYLSRLHSNSYTRHVINTAVVSLLKLWFSVDDLPIFIYRYNSRYLRRRRTRMTEQPLARPIERLVVTSSGRHWTYKSVVWLADCTDGLHLVTSENDIFVSDYF